MKRVLFIGAEVAGPDTVWGGSRATSHNFIESMKLSQRYSVTHIGRGSIRKPEDIPAILHANEHDLLHVDDTRVLQLFFQLGYRPDVIGPIARAPNGVKVYGSPENPWKSIYTPSWFYDGVLIRLNANEERSSQYAQKYITISQGVDTEALAPVPGALETARYVLWAGDAKRPAKNFELFSEIVRITNLPAPFEFKVMSGYHAQDYWKMLDDGALLINTSKYESFCAALFEAKAKGVPTIYRHGLHNDRFEDGRLQVEYRAEAYKSAILSLLANPERRLEEGRISREYATSQASFYVMRDSYEAAYDAAMLSRKPRPTLASSPTARTSPPVKSPTPRTRATTRSLIKKGGKFLVRKGVMLRPSLAHRLALMVLNITTHAGASKPQLHKKTLSPSPKETLSQIAHFAPETQAGVLSGLVADDLVDERLLYRHLTSLIRAGEHEAVRVIAAQSFVTKRLRLYFLMRAAHSVSFLPMSRNELEDFFGITRGHFLARPANHVLGEQVARMRDRELILWLVGALSDKEIVALPHPTVAGMVRQLIQAGDNPNAKSLLEKHCETISPENSFYFLELHNILDGGKHRTGWREILKDFSGTLSHPDSAAASDFNTLVVEKTLSLPDGERDLMDVRFDPAQRERLLNIVSDAIRSQRPLSLVRLGDGEAYAFDYPTSSLASPDEFEADRALREHVWWGAQLDPSLSEALRSGVRDATAASDIIGFPSVYRFARDRSHAGSRWGLSTSQRGLLTLTSQLGEQIPTDAAIFTEERCHQVVMEKEQLERWAALADRVVIVGCWDSLDIFDKKAKWIKVTSQAKLFDATSGDRSRALPYTYLETLTELDSVKPGDLVLVAAGLIGKIFVHKAKQQGAVAIDIGSVLDYLAGYQTRSIADVI